MKMIERYYSIILDGEGYIWDRMNDRKIVIFDFRANEDELAKKVCKKCLEVLNDDN